ASLGSLSLAAIEGPRWGWASTGSVAAFSLSVVAAALFLRRQAGANHAGGPLPLLRPPGVAALPCVASAVKFRAAARPVPPPPLFPDHARRFGTGCCSRAATDVPELHGNIAALRPHC